MAGFEPLPGALRWSLGDLTITALNDGWFQGSLDLVTGKLVQIFDGSLVVGEGGF